MLYIVKDTVLEHWGCSVCTFYSKDDGGVEEDEDSDNDGG